VAVAAKTITTRRKIVKVIKSSTGLAYVCDLCGFSLEKKCDLLSHIRRHAAMSRHKCKVCLDTFNTRMLLHNHSLKAHGRGVIGSVEYSKSSAECDICGKRFSLERLKFHMRLHEMPNLTCDHCGRPFKSRTTLEKHIIGRHTSDRRYTCTTCGKSFKKLAVLKQHEETHNPIKIYVQCEMCNSMMLVKSLKLHMEIQHGNRYKERPHVCDCGKAFRYVKQLTKHVADVHESRSKGIIYPCSECDQVFTRRQDLRNHSFDHYAGQVYECSICSLKFKKKKLLTTHESTHNPTQYPCPVCGIIFQTRGGRRKHKAKVHEHQQFTILPEFN